MKDLGDGSERRSARMRARLRTGSEGAEARIERGLGAPALIAIAAGAVGSSIYFALGIVADDALGLTPVAFLAAGIFFILTVLTYVEGNSLHPERGGASVFARYALNELWSFVTGWAILLDFLIVMAIGALTASGYLAVFWDAADDSGIQLAIAGGVLAWVAYSNFRGQTAERYRFVLRLMLLSALLFAAIVAIGLFQFHDFDALVDSVELGESPSWESLVFSVVVAGAALAGIESASGLAGELRVGRAGLRRVVAVGAIGVLVMFVGMSLVAVLALPIEGGETALGDEYLHAPVVGVVSQFDPEWLRETLRYVVGGVGALVLVQAVNGQMLGIGRLVYSLGTHRQIPSLVSRLHRRYATPYVAIVLAAPWRSA